MRISLRIIGTATCKLLLMTYTSIIGRGHRIHGKAAERRYFDFLEVGDVKSALQHLLSLLGRRAKYKIKQKRSMVCNDIMGFISENSCPITFMDG